MPALVMTKLRSGCGLMRSRSHAQGLAEIRFRLGLLALNLSKAFPTTSGCKGHSLKAPQRGRGVMSSTWEFVTSTTWPLQVDPGL